MRLDKLSKLLYSKSDDVHQVMRNGGNMPPKAKFTREEVINAALELVSERGQEALTSRELGARLGISARPVFTAFGSMEELQTEVFAAALKRFESYAKKAELYTPVLKKIGMQMVLFSIEEPKLYKLLFMSENSKARSFDDVFARLGPVGQQCIEFIIGDYGLTKEDAMKLFEHVWIHTFGIGALCATGMCCFSKEQTVELLGQDFVAMLMLVKSGQLNRQTVVPELKTEQ